MLRRISLVLVLIFCSPRSSLLAQTRNATLHGTVTDPTGAVISGASIRIITPGGQTITSTATNASGAYQSRTLAPGTYIVVVSAEGSAASSSHAVTLAPGQSVQYSVALQIQVEQQDIQVDADAPTVDTDPDKNANAIVLKGKDLDALSDDPDELQNELQALAGPSAGPNGGQLYVDGFSGGRSGGFGGGLGGQGLSGSQGGPVRVGESSSHKYSFTLSASGQNIFNHENLGTPNDTLSSSFFGKSQSLAGGFFGPSTAGNRSIFFETVFHF
jgi:hypothetical protein